MEITAQIIGFVAMAVSIAIFWQRKRKNMLVMKLTTDVLWASHHMMIFNYTAAVTTAVAILREFVFYNYDKKWARSKWWSVVFSAVFAAAAVITWRDAYSIIPAISCILSTVAYGSKSVMKIKVFAFLASVGMLINGIHYRSLPTFVNECLTELSIISAICITAYKEKNREDEDFVDL